MSTADVGIWIAVATGIVSVMAALYSLYREWQAWRQNQAQRLSAAAAVAVRRAEAGVVRPLLGARLVDGIAAFVARHPDLDALRFRTLLYADLQRCVRLTDDEKHVARETAVNNLIGLLRAMPSPPLRLHSDGQVARQRGRLSELVETAYSARARPSGDMIEGLGTFCGRSTG
jgi:hypothetical protein